MSGAFAPGDLAVDCQLADVAERFRFLLDLTPINVDEARRAFDEHGGDNPRFKYRPLENDPATLETELEKVDVDAVSHPTVAHLAQAKRRELQLQVAMLSARDTAAFRSLSTELYGTVTPALLTHAEAILADLAANAPEARHEGGDCLDAASFARLAAAELDHYRAFDPDLSAHVEVRDDCSGVIVADGDLLVARSTQVTPERAAALLHHEVGTHVLTYVNGCRQPLRLLSVGLAGYDETQEGLAVLAEFLTGGLTSARLRQLAARVVAVHGMIEGRTFREVHADLVTRGFTATGAFTMTMRVFRAGGFTKDLVYLRGLVDLVAHVRAIEDLEVLWLGKMSLSDAPLVAELWHQGALRDPVLRPRYLDGPGIQARLDTLASARSVADLVGG